MRESEKYREIELFLSTIFLSKYRKIHVTLCSLHVEISEGSSL